jgi:hypothetical protein
MQVPGQRRRNARWQGITIRRKRIQFPLGKECTDDTTTSSSLSQMRMAYQSGVMASAAQPGKGDIGRFRSSVSVSTQAKAFQISTLFW